MGFRALGSQSDKIWFTGRGTNGQEGARCRILESTLQRIRGFGSGDEVWE